MKRIEKPVMLGRPAESWLCKVVVSLADTSLIGEVVSDSPDRSNSGNVTIRLTDASERRLVRGDLRIATPKEKNEFLHNNLHLAISGEPLAVPDFGS